MANIENLRVPTSEEAREIGRKGGIASGKARREKRNLRNAVEAILNAPAPTEHVEKMKAAGVEDNDYFAALGYALIKRAMEGDVAAFNSVRDLIGEKPKEEVAVNANVNNPLSDLTTDELKKLIDDD